MNVLLDTSAIIAVLDKDDRFHSSAVSVWSNLINNDDDLVMCGYTMVETCALLQYRYGLDVLQAFAVNMMPTIEIVWPSDLAHNAALAEVLRGPANGKGPSLVDCVTIEIGKSEGVKDIFSYDKHFAHKGFDLVG